MSTEWFETAANVIRQSNDEQLEQRICDACDRLCMATTQDQAYTELEQIRVLIAQRSTAQIARLERAKGLRK